LAFSSTACPFAERSALFCHAGSALSCPRKQTRDRYDVQPLARSRISGAPLR